MFSFIVSLFTKSIPSDFKFVSRNPYKKAISDFNPLHGRYAFLRILGEYGNTIKFKMSFSESSLSVLCKIYIYLMAVNTKTTDKMHP
jgi:hypothetical protein